MPAGADAQGALAGRGILVTRPAHQAEGLCALIEAAGGRALRFPVLEIRPAADVAAVQAGLGRLAESDLAVFVSANAVNCTLDTLAPRPWPADVRIAAVGAATARALEDRGLHVTHCPETGFTSEALLALPALRDMSGRRVLILRGDGGREQLRETLTARGAQVDYLEVYQRAQAQTEFLGQIGGLGGNVVQRLMPIDLGLAQAKEVQVRAVQKGDALGHALTLAVAGTERKEKWRLSGP